MQARNVAAIGAGVIAVIVLMGAAVGYFLWAVLLPKVEEVGLPEFPDFATTPGPTQVFMGGDRFVKAPLRTELTLTAVGTITDFYLDESGRVYGVAGEKGVAMGGPVVRAVGDEVFEWEYSSNPYTVLCEHVDFVRLGGGRLGLMTREFSDWDILPLLMNPDGQVLWTYVNAEAFDMAGGDLDGDGTPEFAVGGTWGLHLLDREGQLRWALEGIMPWQIEIVDTNGDGRLEIVHCDDEGVLTVRDGAGEVLSKAPLPATSTFFSICRWPDAQGAPAVLLAEGGQVHVLGFDGKVRTTLAAPGVGDEAQAWATPVAFEAEGPSYFAVLVNQEFGGMTVLFIYDGEGNIVYQESLGEYGEAIAAASSDAGSGQVLVVGGTGNAWSYTLAPGVE